MHRMVGFRWSPGSADARRHCDRMSAALSNSSAWRVVIEARGFRLFIAESDRDIAATVIPNNRGLILGPIFSANEPKPLGAAIAAEEADAWCESNGAALTKAYWGGYLAILADGARDRVLVIRDPMGARPAFVWEMNQDGCHVVFTHLADLAAAAQLPEVDEAFLPLFLAQPRLVTERTGLAGVREVLAGECFMLEAKDANKALAWRPPPPDPRLGVAEADALAQNLRRTIIEAVGAWLCLSVPIVHRLSGGLDSSIALYALRSHGADVQCVNEYPEGMDEGDERMAARAMASSVGARLIEIAYRPSAINYERIIDAPLSPKPSITDLSFADRSFLEAAGGDALALLTSGQGGDQVFFRANAQCVAADAVRGGRGPGAIVSIALSAARASRQSVWPVLRSAIEYGIVRSPRGYLQNLLQRAVSGSAEARRTVIELALADPWVKGAMRSGPGQAVRALLLADLQYYHAASILQGVFLPTPVLTSQPIVERCCAIPTYRTIEGGRDRSLARRAFAADLPPSAVERRRKGDTTRFFKRVMQANGDFVCDLLKDGELVQRGLFDSARLSDLQVAGVGDISTDLVAELWLRRIKAARLQSHA